MALFDNYCSSCGQFTPTYAIDRSGNVPKVFCSSICETEFNRAAKMKDFIVFVEDRKSIGTEELTKRISEKSWNNREYLVEEIQI